MSQKLLFTVRQFSERNPAFSQSALRAIIFNARHNGFAPAIKRVGRKILLDEAEFFAVIDRQNGGKK
ncbi:hypothetical protein ABZN20_14310 [Methylococcus sp. ANG]|uniref:hypothetical protein n=1 Tax=Methylococcus sp. ANG TaxID=3231903 RepID=UPI003459C30F